MLNLWATYNKIEYRSSIPHGYLLCRFLDHEDFELEEREIVEREKAERVRRREELRNRVQEQVSEYPHRSPKIERGGSRSPSGEESETLNLKKSEKVWSPESCTSCVQGYNVKNSIAPILEAIFVKHGDIAASKQ
ncbi:hypothetical protein L2E82_50258 [Cichorium intybus]|nr:hypothetical protein L2E82_50258 [Cichorium intybus]